MKMTSIFMSRSSYILISLLIYFVFFNINYPNTLRLDFQISTINGTTMLKALINFLPEQKKQKTKIVKLQQIKDNQSKTLNFQLQNLNQPLGQFYNLQLLMAAKNTPLSKALSLWQEKSGKPASQAQQIKLVFLIPPIDKLQTSVLSTLNQVQKLSISSNCIDKMVNFPPLKYLTRLSLSRNNIKKISGLQQVAGTLKQLWLSYNNIQKLDGLSMCTKLTTLFIGNNKIKAWQQLDKLRQLPEFQNILLTGNPFYQLLKDDAKYYALKKVPNLKNIDGIIVEAKFTAKSNEFPDNFPPPIK